MLGKYFSLAVISALSVSALPTPRSVDGSVVARDAQADTGNDYNDDNGGT